MIKPSFIPYDCSRITLELKDYLASLEGESDVAKLFDFDYPTYYQGADKTAFEQKVIDHFLFRQIGFETTDRFKHMFKLKLREIMPYYVQMYQSCELVDPELHPDINPMENYHLNERYEGAGSSTGKTTNSGKDKTTSTNSGKDTTEHRHLDTPQGQFSNLNSVTASSSGYMTDADGTELTHGLKNITELENGKVVDNDIDTEDSHTLERYGNIGVQTYSDLLKAWRETFVNIDMMIIKELNELFLAVY